MSACLSYQLDIILRLCAQTCTRNCYALICLCVSLCLYLFVSLRLGHCHHQISENIWICQDVGQSQAWESGVGDWGVRAWPNELEVGCQRNLLSDMKLSLFCGFNVGMG